jgi:hypothetical protein
MSQNWNNLEREYWRDLEQTAPNEDYLIEYRAFRLGAEFKGLTKSQQRDFNYYLENGRKEKCYPNFIRPDCKLAYKPKNVEEWFWLWDTHGYSRDKELESPNYKDSEAIKQIKEFTNLTIKMWVEDCVSNLFQPKEIITSFQNECPNAPRWIIKAFIEQCKREIVKKQGFLLKFQREQLGVDN